MDRLDDPGLKNLLVWIDEQSQAKGIAHKLTECEVQGGCPQLLRNAIDNITWRGEEQSHQDLAVRLTQSLGQTGQSDEAAQQMDDATQEMLRQLNEFHQRRASKNSA